MVLSCSSICSIEGDIQFISVQYGKDTRLGFSSIIDIWKGM